MALRAASEDIPRWVQANLDREMTDRHREQLRELERAGQHLVCSALIVGGAGGKSFGVRLQIKPDIGRRWAAGAKPSS